MTAASVDQLVSNYQAALSAAGKLAALAPCAARKAELMSDVSTPRRPLPEIILAVGALVLLMSASSAASARPGRHRPVGRAARRRRVGAHPAARGDGVTFDGAFVVDPSPAS